MKISHTNAHPIRCGDWRLCEFECAWPLPPPSPQHSLESSLNRNRWADEMGNLLEVITEGGEGGPTCSGRGEGVFLSLSQRTVCSDALLISLCSTQDLVKRRCHREGALLVPPVAPKSVGGRKHTLCAHFTRPCSMYPAGPPF